jgi:hypothetical protein
VAIASLSTVESSARRAPTAHCPIRVTVYIAAAVRPATRRECRAEDHCHRPHTAGATYINGAEPIPVPEPFAGMLRFHLHNRPNLRTTRDSAATAAALRVVSISTVGGCVISGSVGVTCGTGDMG